MHQGFSRTLWYHMFIKNPVVWNNCYGKLCKIHWIKQVIVFLLQNIVAYWSRESDFLSRFCSIFSELILMIDDALLSIVFMIIIVYYWFILLTKTYSNKITTTTIIIFARVNYEAYWPEYLFAFIPQINHLYETRLLKDVTVFYWKTNVFKYLLFPSAILEWNRLERKIR